MTDRDPPATEPPARPPAADPVALWLGIATLALLAVVSAIYLG